MHINVKRLLSAVISALFLFAPWIALAEADYFSTQADTADGGYILSGTTDWQGEIPPDACFARYGATGQLLWRATLGGSGIEHGLQAAGAQDGGTVVLLSTDSADGDMADNIPSEFNTLSYNSILYKLDSTGSVLWRHPFFEMDRYAAWVTAIHDGFLISGQTYENVPWVVFVDEAGNERWRADYDELGHGIIYSTIALANHDILHVGRFFTPIPDSNFHIGEGWIVRTDATGAVLWSKRYSQDAYDAINGAVELDNGELLLCGVSAPSIFVLAEMNETRPWLLKTSADGTLLWSRLPADAGSSFSSIRKTDSGFELGASHYGYEAFASFFIDVDSEGNLQK